MQDKQIDNQIWIIMIAIPFLATLAKNLNASSCNPFSWKSLVIQLFVGTTSGMLFGFLACWLIGNYQGAVGAFAGFGAVLGIHGVERISLVLERWLTEKFR